MRHFVRYLCSFWLVCLLLSSAALAQVTSATLNGVVTDPGGSAIPGAKLVINNVDTNAKQAAVSGDTGLYSVSQLLPGRYTVTVVKDGFSKSVQTGIVLTVGEVATLNIALQLGDVKEEVTVTANAELINVTTAELSSVVNQESVQELPLNGRDPSSLVLLTTGTTSLVSSTGSAVGGGWLQSTNAMPDESGASSGGGRQGSTYYILDGSPNMDTYMGLAAPFPNADATQEFRVITENFDAQYGFSPSAVVTIQTKSGANATHGGLFEFVRNNDLNAANFFSHAVDPLKRNQFGGFVGGPIRKDKLFFFANYQATRMSTAATSNTTYTPTQAMLNGDFSAVNVTLPAPFVNNVMDPATWKTLVTNANAPGYAAYTLATTALPLGSEAGTGKMMFVGPSQKSSYDEGTARLDYTINDKQRVFLRNFTQYYNAKGGSLKGNIANDAYVDASPAEYYNVALDHSWMINNSTVNNFSLYYSQMDISDTAQALDKSGDAVCWSRYIAVSEMSGHCDLEGLYVYGGPGGTFASSWGYYMGERRSTWGLSDQFTKTIGRHTLAAGIDAHKQFAQENTDYPVAPIIYFNGTITGFGWADFLLGYASNFQQGAGEIASVKGWQMGLYGQEQFKLKPNLTLTAGVRWDPNLPPAMTGGRGAAFHEGQQSTMYPNAPKGVVFPGDKGVSDGLMPNSYGYFQPRVGLSWQPSFATHTAVRAGFGLFTGPFPYSYYNHSADIAPFSPTFNFASSTTLYPSYIPLANPYQNLSGGNPFPPFASLTTKPSTSSTFQTPMSLGAIFSNNFRNSMTESWSLSIEQQLSQTVALHLAYVGSESYHQPIVVDQNPGCVPGYVSGCTVDSNVRIIEPDLIGQILTVESAGNASYHSLQTSVDKRVSHGLQVHSNFTWSKVMDLASEGDPSQGGSFPGIGNPYDLKANRSISDLNRPLISTTNFTYTSPSLQGHSSLVRNVLGDWGLSSIYTLQSGRPFGVSASNSANNSGSLQDHDRADRVTGTATNVRHGSRTQWLNSYINMDAFTDNAAGSFGHTARNLFKAPYLNTADTSISKNWKYGDRYGLQFRWEMFNTFNHTSFDVPASSGPTSSDISVGSSSEITKVGPVAPRVMQGALKLTF
jgi:hypothetical protein